MAPRDVKMKQIAASTSSYHTCGITLETSDLVCWGENRKGEAPALKQGPFSHVAVGFRTTCVIPADGSEVDCFGVSGHLFQTRRMEEHRDRIWEQVTVGQ